MPATNYSLLSEERSLGGRHHALHNFITAPAMAVTRKGRLWTRCDMDVILDCVALIAHLGAEEYRATT